MKKLYASKNKTYKYQIQLFLAVFALLSASFYSYSQVRVDFDPRASIYSPNKTIYNVKGDFTMMGNTNLTLVNYGNNTNNGGNDMRYVDVDNDPYTLNSSSATLQFSTENGAIPECSNIVYAGLYWSGRAGSSNTFTVSKNINTGNTTTQQVTTDYTVYSAYSIPNTNYTLNVTNQGSGQYRFRFSSSGAGDTVDFIYRTSGWNETVHVSVNNGPEQAISTSYIDDNNAYLNSDYQIFSDSNYTLSVDRLRLQGYDRAYVDVTYNETIPETILVTKNYDKRKISIKGPNATSYTELTAANNEIYYPNGVDDNMYSAYTEITDYVRANGIGEYFLADMALREGDPDGTGYYGGWGMVVVYENTKMKWRDVTVFDGHAYVVSSNNNSYIIDVDGFNSTQSGDVNVKLGMMAGEGDVGFTGDTFQIENRNSGNYTSLSHAGNSTGNFFNSSVSTGGNPRNPPLQNNTGIDISMFTINNTGNAIINNNQTSTSFRYFTDGDTYSIYNVTFSVDAYIPESEGVLATTTINGNPVGSQQLVVEPGDEIEYGVQIKNKGTEAIEDSRLVIPIPFTSNYVLSSITFNEYHSLFAANPPYFDPNEGATGAIVWDIDYLPLNSADLEMVLADISFKLKATEDCSILVNNNCTPKIVILGGYISGTGVISGIDYSLPLIQGYQQNGVCQGEPNTEPIEINIDSEQYILDNCTGVSIEREFFYCSFDGNSIPVSQVEAHFPPGSLFYDSYPITPSTTQYTSSNPFPATLGVSTYYAIPPGNSTCNYIFTIEVNDIETTPTTSNVAYCLNETASPLTATTTDTDYILLYYTDNDPNTVGQSSITPSTNTAGTFTYYVSEGPSNTCHGNRVPLTVTVYDPISITLEEQINESCENNNSGAIDISVTGGSGNYTFDWDNNGEEDPDSDTEDLTGLAAGTYTITVSDANSNCSATESFTITTEDNTAPVITVPEDITVEGCSTADILNGNLTALPYSETAVVITIQQFTSENGTYTEDSVAQITYQDEASQSCPIVVKRSFKITDNCGLSDSGIQNITIQNPSFSITEPNGSSSVACIDDATETFTMPTITDNCGNTLTPSAAVVTDNPDPITCNGTRTYTYTYTDCTNTQQTWSFVYTIEVEDFTAPTATSDTVACYDNIVLPTLPTVADNCGNTLTPSAVVESTSPDCEGDITYTWTYTDCEGNTHDYVHTVTIEVEDFTAPTATSDTVACYDNIVLPTLPTVTDNCGNTLTPSAVVESTSPDCEGDITYTWTYTDCEGNTHDYVHTVTIEVEDFTAPAPTSDTVACYDNIVLPTLPTVTDNCGNTLTPSAVVESTSPDCEGDITYTWTYTDCEGNTHDYVHIVTIEVEDFTVPNNQESDISCIEDAQVTPTPPSVTDNCGNNINPTGPTISNDPSCNGSKTYTWTYTDCEGNAHDWTYTYNLNDNINPVITVQASPIVIECDGSGNSSEITNWLNNNGGATATDNCGSVTWTNNYGANNSSCTDPILVTFTATDACGNQSTTSATYIIQDTIAPEITNASNLTVECDGLGNTAELNAWLNSNGGATATDDCSAVVWTNNFNTLSDDCGETGSATVQFTATDGCGNISTTSATFTIEDTTPPTIDIEPSDLTVECGPSNEQQLDDWIHNHGGATASDQCSDEIIWEHDFKGELIEECGNTGYIEVKFKATDACGNEIITSAVFTVIDTTAPVAPQAPADVTYECIADVPAAV
ncbi:hypothetical protein, partial [Corallibacter sp.]|uniref:HYR-like domain-containing protein n=1 Tax=Corallibacter sp. TaxID=2038084 RepID=UPI003AB3B730